MMSDHHRLWAGLFIVFSLSACGSETVQSPDKAKHSVQYDTVEWIDLMPASDLEQLLNPHRTRR